MLRICASTIYRRTYRHFSQNWNGEHGEKFGKESKIHNSEIQVMESAETILRCQTKICKDGKKKSNYKSFSSSVDLTKIHYLLLSEAKGFIKNNNIE